MAPDETSPVLKHSTAHSAARPALNPGFLILDPGRWTQQDKRHLQTDIQQIRLGTNMSTGNDAVLMAPWSTSLQFRLETSWVLCHGRNLFVPTGWIWPRARDEIAGCANRAISVQVPKASRATAGI